MGKLKEPVLKLPDLKEPDHQLLRLEMFYATDSATFLIDTKNQLKILFSRLLKQLRKMKLSKGQVNRGDLYGEIIRITS